MIRRRSLIAVALAAFAVSPAVLAQSAPQTLKFGHV